MLVATIDRREILQRRAARLNRLTQARREAQRIIGLSLRRYEMESRTLDGQLEALAEREEEDRIILRVKRGGGTTLDALEAVMEATGRRMTAAAVRWRIWRLRRAGKL